MKNPFMSMWLSNANRALGVGLGTAMAETRRQQSAAAKEAMPTRRPRRRSEAKEEAACEAEDEVNGAQALSARGGVRRAASDRGRGCGLTVAYGRT